MYTLNYPHIVFLKVFDVASYEFGNQANPDQWAILIKGFQENWLFFLLLVVVNALVLQWISGGASWTTLLGAAVLVFDMAPIAIMAVEMVFFGELGGFTKTSFYHMFGLYQAYNIIMDWDSSIVRFCMEGDVNHLFKVILDYLLPFISLLF